MNNELPIYVIYDHPKDYPEHYVVRRQVIRGGQIIPDANPMLVTEDLEKIRQGMKRLGLTRLVRRTDDDPVIVETWL